MNIRKLRSYFSKHIPTQHTLRNTILYRVVGERLFDTNLWKPTRKNTALGLALGVFIALTPTIGVQMIIAGMAAYLLKANIPSAVGAVWISNPVTMPIIYPLQYKLGFLIWGPPKPPKIYHYLRFLRVLLKHAETLWIGSLISASFFGILTYFVVYAIWDFIKQKLSTIESESSF